MKLTTVCYIRHEGKVLMLHRIKKKIDINQGKWIGVGGKMEPGESPFECVLREVWEETGLRLLQPQLGCMVTFQFLDPDPALTDWDTEYMFAFTCDQFEGTLKSDCPEGELRWIPEDKLGQLSLWPGYPLFLEPLLAGRPFFSLKIVYRGDALVRWSYESAGASEGRLTP